METLYVRAFNFPARTHPQRGPELSKEPIRWVSTRTCARRYYQDYRRCVSIWKLANISARNVTSWGVIRRSSADRFSLTRCSGVATSYRSIEEAWHIADPVEKPGTALHMCEPGSRSRAEAAHVAPPERWWDPGLASSNGVAFGRRELTAFGQFGQRSPRNEFHQKIDERADLEW